MLARALQEAKLLEARATPISQEQTEQLNEILYREPGLGELLLTFISENTKPQIDLIAVTSGPGLEPALWVGINFARALSYIWNIPVVPVNHMEGHVLSSIFSINEIPKISFPAIALLISGGHTELDLMRDWAQYERIGETRDDAVGEAFDKVARMLGLPYPGGPEIGSRARRARAEHLPEFTKLPRPMLDAQNFDFSFSGLKTAVRYAIEGRTLSENEIDSVAREFEDAVTEVLLNKTQRALLQHHAQTVILGGGVSANSYIRDSFKTFFTKEYPDLTLYFPPQNLSTDNSVMIALAGHVRASDALSFEALSDLRADGNLSLSSNLSTCTS